MSENKKLFALAVTYLLMPIIVAGAIIAIIYYCVH